MTLHPLSLSSLSLYIHRVCIYESYKYFASVSHLQNTTIKQIKEERKEEQQKGNGIYKKRLRSAHVPIYL